MINFEYYLNSIVESNKDKTNVIDKEEIDVKKISEFSEKLKDVRLSVNKIDELWKKRIKLNKSLIEKQSPEYKKEIYHLIYRLNSLQILLKQKQSVNEYITVLSQYLKYLKVSIFRKDNETTKKIMEQFVTNKLNLTYLMTQVQEFNENINDYEKTYDKLMLKLNDVNMPLESKLSMVLSPKSPSFFNELKNSNKQQKYLIYHIGKNFINIINSSLSKKEISKIITKF